jgi:hypothetical protein
MSMNAEFDFWLTMGSTYTCLSALRIPEVERLEALEKSKLQPLRIAVNMKLSEWLIIWACPYLSFVGWRDTVQKQLICWHTECLRLILT